MQYGHMPLADRDPAFHQNALGQALGSYQRPDYRPASNSPPQPPAHSPLAFAVQGAAASPALKRKQPDNPALAHTLKRRRDTQQDDPDAYDLDAAAQGAKHWTDDEKSRLFNWLMGPGQEDHWNALRATKNSCLRECAIEVFGGKKTYQALKGCYERNFNLFKQIYAFESAHGQPGVSGAALASLSEADRLREYERRLASSARAATSAASLRAPSTTGTASGGTISSIADGTATPRPRAPSRPNKAAPPSPSAPAPPPAWAPRSTTTTMTAAPWTRSTTPATATPTPGAPTAPARPRPGSTGSGSTCTTASSSSSSSSELHQPAGPARHLGRIRRATRRRSVPTTTATAATTAATATTTTATPAANTRPAPGRALSPGLHPRPQRCRRCAPARARRRAARPPRADAGPRRQVHPVPRSAGARGPGEARIPEKKGEPRAGGVQRAEGRGAAEQEREGVGTHQQPQCRPLAQAGRDRVPKENIPAGPITCLVVIVSCKTPPMSCMQAIHGPPRLRVPARFAVCCPVYSLS
ncbi:hypothetical protein BJ912DRAFT_658803 [Pholiota molesta]|nr:hypothetical protein BJ912DRAFT_658803 [Pholiota molesta]